jgi:hypothetical protein
MNPCRVCNLGQEDRAAIDEALQNGVPLEQISRGCGISDSSLHRHFHRHVKADATKVSTGKADMKSPEPVRSSVSMPAVLEPIHEASLEKPTKQQLLERIEMLWGEGFDGLEATKEAIYLTRADGSKVELHAGDLRARKGFIGELREILRLQGEATGDLVRGQSVEANFAIQIVVPNVQVQPEQDDYAFEIALPRR